MGLHVTLGFGPWTLDFGIYRGVDIPWFNNLFEECVNNGFDSLGLSCFEFGLP